MQGRIFKTIAYVHTDFPAKFGIPRQSGLADTAGRIIFEKEYRSREAVRGLEEYSHLWILWEFSEAVREEWSHTVRPPRLGGNKRVGVFATRSPFRPNPVGLSCVKLEKIEFTEKGPVLHISGADMLDGTPVYDIKPYLPYVDSHPEADGGLAERVKEYELELYFPRECLEKVPEGKREVLKQILRQDPRPSYQKDSERIYGMEFAGMEVKFQVRENCLIVKGIIA